MPKLTEELKSLINVAAFHAHSDDGIVGFHELVTLELLGTHLVQKADCLREFATLRQANNTCCIAHMRRCQTRLLHLSEELHGAFG